MLSPSEMFVTFFGFLVGGAVVLGLLLWGFRRLADNFTRRVR